MQNLQKSTPSKTEEYNQIPVFYCVHCLSLAIASVEGALDYCTLCGSTKIENTQITVWETKYKEKYGEEYLQIKKTKKNNGQRN